MSHLRTLPLLLLLYCAGVCFANVQLFYSADGNVTCPPPTFGEGYSEAYRFCSVDMYGSNYEDITATGHYMANYDEYVLPFNFPMFGYEMVTPEVYIFDGNFYIWTDISYFEVDVFAADSVSASRAYIEVRGSGENLRAIISFEDYYSSPLDKYYSAQVKLFANGRVEVHFIKFNVTKSVNTYTGIYYKLYPGTTDFEYYDYPMGEKVPVDDYSHLLTVFDVLAEPIANPPVQHVTLTHPNDAGMSVTVTGANFGSDTDRFTITISGETCQITSMNNTQIVFELPPVGGKNLNPILTTYLGFVLPLPVVVTYPPPWVSYVSFSETRQRSSSVTISIFGNYFGPPSTAPNARTVSVGTHACRNIKIISNSVLECVLMGEVRGVNLPVVVTVDGQKNDYMLSPVLDFPDPSRKEYCNFPNGAQDYYAPEYCNCFAGFAPSSDSFSDCSVPAKCAEYMLEKNTLNRFFSHPVVSFTSDRLSIVQTAPIVKGRRDVSIFFESHAGMTSADTCNYPGNIWMKTVSSLDCMDIYTASMPWTQHGMCGFTESNTSSSQFHVYTTTLISFARDEVRGGEGEGRRIHTTKNSYVLTVRFARTLSVVLQGTQVQNVGDSPIQIDITSDLIKDYESGDIYVDFTTTVAYPYQVGSLTASWTPAASNVAPEGYMVTATPTSTDLTDTPCAMLDHEDCVQTWTMRVKTVNDDVVVCNLRGTFAIAATEVLCRDDETIAACTWTEGNLTDATISIAADTTLCESSKDVVDVSQGMEFTVSLHTDQSDTEESQSVFDYGDTVHVEVLLDSDTLKNSIDAIAFARVYLATAGEEVQEAEGEVLFALQNGASPSTIDSTAKFNITYEQHTLVSPGTGDTARLSFDFTLSRNMPLLASVSEGYDISLTLTITLNIYYHGVEEGGRKRGEEKSEGVSVAGTTTHVVSQQLVVSSQSAAGAVVDVQQGDSNQFTSATNPASSATLYVSYFYTILSVISVVLCCMW